MQMYTLESESYQLIMLSVPHEIKLFGTFN